MSTLAFSYVEVFGPRWGHVVHTFVVLACCSGIAASFHKAGSKGCAVFVAVVMAGILIFAICILPPAAPDKNEIWNTATDYVRAAVEASGEPDFGYQDPEQGVQARPDGEYQVKGWVKFSKEGQRRHELFEAVIHAGGENTKLKSLRLTPSDQSTR